MDPVSVYGPKSLPVYSLLPYTYTGSLVWMDMCENRVDRIGNTQPAP